MVLNQYCDAMHVRTMLTTIVMVIMLESQKSKIIYKREFDCTDKNSDNKNLCQSLTLRNYTEWCLSKVAGAINDDFELMPNGNFFFIL